MQEEILKTQSTGGATEMRHQNRHNYSILGKLILCIVAGGTLVFSSPVWGQPLTNVQQDALRAVASENWSEAVRLYQKAIQLSPQQAGLYNNLGVAQRQAGDRLGAISSYRKAIELDPDFSEAYGNLAVLLLLEGEWLETLMLLNQARSLGVASPSLFLYYGIASEKSQNWEDAAQAYDRYLKTNPSATVAYRSAIAFWQSGEGREAIRAFKRAAQLDPGFGLYTSETGLALANLGANRSAIEFLKDLPTGWSQPRDFVVLARLAQQEDMLDLAEASLFRAFQLRQSQGEAIPTSWISDAGAIDAQRGDLDSAAATFQSAMDGKLPSPWPAEQAAPASAEPQPTAQPDTVWEPEEQSPQHELTLSQTGNQPDGDPSDVLSQTDRGVAIAAANLADTYLSQENYALALSASDAAISADATLPVAHNNRGAALLSLNELEAAKQSFEAAIELQPDYWQAQRNLGIVYIQQGDRQQAQEYLGQAMANAPTLELVQQINEEMVILDRSELKEEPK